MRKVTAEKNGNPTKLYGAKLFRKKLNQKLMSASRELVQNLERRKTDY